MLAMIIKSPNSSGALWCGRTLLTLYVEPAEAAVNAPTDCKQGRAIGVGRGEANDVLCHGKNPREEKVITTLTPAVREDGNADRDNKSSRKRRDRRGRCTGAITHAVDDSWRKISQAEEHIAPEEGHDSQNENLGEQR